MVNKRKKRQKRREVWSRIAVVLLAVVLLSRTAKPEPTQVLFNLPAGSILLSRNRDERENTSPGYWNHLAIVDTTGDVIEDQAEQGGVIRTLVVDYLSRDYGRILVYQPLDMATGERAAARAETLVGLPHRTVSSLRRRFPPRARQRGLNCVSVIEIAYGPEDRQIRRLKVPDGITRFNRLFAEPEALR
jgi:hypothetical protein